MTDQYQRPISTGLQLLYLFMLWIGCTIIGAVISMGIIVMLYGRGAVGEVLEMTNTTTPYFLPAFRIFIALGNSLLSFLAPAIIFSQWVMQEPEEYVGARNYFPKVLLAIAALFMLALLPVIDITGYLNQKMTLPPSLHGLEQWIRATEKAAEASFKVLLDMKTPADLVISLFIVAVFPALSEEFFFRGCMQPIFQRMTKNIHASVWITAFIFSFIHFEFLGFVPRLLLGAGLGYCFAWSGSIWPSVVVHFVNNGVAVVLLYMYQHKQLAGDPDSGQPMFTQMWIYGVSLIVSIGLMLLFRRISLAHEPIISEDDNEKITP